MIVCPICTVKNHHLSAVCSSCGSYIQTRIDGIDLFSTIWLLFEAPRNAFKKILLSRRKNFILVVSGVAGIEFLSFVFQLLCVADRGLNLFNILLYLLLLAPATGVLIQFVVSLFLFAAVRAIGSQSTFLNIRAVWSWSMLPICLLALGILPLEVSSFGIYLFTKTPQLILMNGTSFILFSMLHLFGFVWSAILLIIGVSVLTDRKVRDAILPSFAGLALSMTMLYYGVRAIHWMIS